MDRLSVNIIVFGMLLHFIGPMAGSSALADIDLQVVFSPPTLDEISAVRSDWQSRPTEADNFTHERYAEAEGFTISRASFYYEGLKQYCLVRFPRHYTESGSFPVLVLHHGGEQGLYYLDALDFDETYPTSCIADSSFVLMPTYRGEAFAGSNVLGNRFSQGEISLWDRDCDDAMAMLTAFLTVTPEADPYRLVSLGRSRGATVAYHMAVRDHRLKRSVVLFGASDFLHEDIQLDCNLEINQGIEATNTLSRKVMAHMVNPWLEGEKSLAEVRQLLTGWSTANTLHGNRKMQLHHGQIDTNIPIDHSYLVDTKMQTLGAGPPNYELFTYPLAGHSTDNMDGYEIRVEDYLCSLPVGGLTPAPLPQTTTILTAWPNPFTDRIQLEIQNPRTEKTSPRSTRVVVYDLRGRQVRELSAGSGEEQIFVWDGLNSNGLEVPAGVYLMVQKNPGLMTGVGVTGVGSSVSKRVLKLR